MQQENADESADELTATAAFPCYKQPVGYTMYAYSRTFFIPLCHWFDTLFCLFPLPVLSFLGPLNLQCVVGGGGRFEARCGLWAGVIYIAILSRRPAVLRSLARARRTADCKQLITLLLPSTILLRIISHWVFRELGLVSALKLHL